MKRFIAVIACLVLLLSCAPVFAMELETLSFDELIELHKATFNAIVSHPDFKSVAVPPGTYEVGKHIPAGEYTLSTNDIMAMIVKNGFDDMQVIQKDGAVGRYILKNGDTIETSGTIYFSPFVGLGF